MDRAAHPGQRLGPLELIAKATLEVRSGILIATVIIVLVLLPLFFLPGIEGRLMQPLAIAYIVSLLASMVVSVTLTPVMSYYLLPKISMWGVVGIEMRAAGELVQTGWKLKASGLPE